MVVPDTRFWKDRGMQGRTRRDRDLWDAQGVAGGLVEEGSVSAFLAGYRRDLFGGSFTADLFEFRAGRPSLSADPVGSVRIAASDRQDRVSDKGAEVITGTGILKGRRKQCVDSTAFDDAVAPRTPSPNW
jgi:hypothetical protein